MTKQFWAIIIVAVAVLIGVFAFTGHKQNTSSSSVQPSNHVTGQGQKHVTLVEYGDFECPVCESYEPTVSQVRQQYAQDITFQFRNFPLTSIHPNAFAGARAAEAAALQGKFWEMHDALYAAQNWQQWSTSSDPTPYFNQYAQSIGLNVAKFKQDFASDQVNNQVNADLAQANKLNLNGTPTFFLDGKQLDNAQLADANGPSLSKFQQLINAEIAKKNPSSPNPTSSGTTTSTTTSPAAQ
ncbi:MAG TPA: thioredoxin domain-containing protein [Candidatus Saccharimonadales bacterium]|nr:thioredoxin domain-containing protein [Candidatus Saccharimonadales bacterium]